MHRYYSSLKIHDVTEVATELFFSILWCRASALVQLLLEKRCAFTLLSNQAYGDLPGDNTGKKIPNVILSDPSHTVEVKSLHTPCRSYKRYLHIFQKTKFKLS